MLELWPSGFRRELALNFYIFIFFLSIERKPKGYFKRRISEWIFQIAYFRLIDKSRFVPSFVDFSAGRIIVELG